MDGRLTESIRKLQRAGKAPVISEIKLRTPRDGDLLKGRDPIELARRMGKCEVAGLSVVTESEHFGGSIKLLEDIAREVDKPILHKDFITTSDQVEESKRLGSSAILLITGMLSDSDLAILHEHAHSVGLETVVEVHTEGELRRVLSLGLDLDILGINNRDIKVLETDGSDVSVTERLAPRIEGDFIILSESSLKTPDDVRRALRGGADSVLIGTAVMQAEDVEGFLRGMIEIWE